MAVRVRPFNKLESKTESKRVIIMEGNTTKTVHPVISPFTLANRRVKALHF